MPREEQTKEIEEKIQVQFLRLLRFQRFWKTAITAETAKTAYAILSIVLLYFPCATCCISLQLMLFCNHLSIVFTLTPRTCACSIASCFVKSVGSIWKNWRQSILPSSSTSHTWSSKSMRLLTTQQPKRDISPFSRLRSNGVTTLLAVYAKLA